MPSSKARYSTAAGGGPPKGPSSSKGKSNLGWDSDEEAFFIKAKVRIISEPFVNFRFISSILQALTTYILHSSFLGKFFCSNSISRSATRVRAIRRQFLVRNQPLGEALEERPPLAVTAMLRKGKCQILEVLTHAEVCFRPRMSRKH